MTRTPAATAQPAAPPDAQPVRDRAAEAMSSGRYSDALAGYDRAIASLRRDDSRLPRWLSERGRVLMALGQNTMALADFDRALAHESRLLSGHANKATALQNLGRLQAALEMHDKAVEIAGDRGDVQYNRANALRSLGRLQEAVEGYKRALALDPEFHTAYAPLIQTLWQAGDIETAHLYADEACRVGPNSADNFVGRALIRQVLGDRDGARQDCEHALEIDPSHVDALSTYVHLDKVRDGEDWRLAKLSGVLQSGRKAGVERASLHYTLGKCYDDLQDVDRAFHHFQRGARIKRALVRYDEAREARSLARVLQTFTRRVVEVFEPNGLFTEQPLFFVGMPRSGTTLTEQILHSHPQVYGAGELDATNEAVRGISLGGKVVDQHGNSEIDGPEVLPERAEGYLATLRARAPSPDFSRIVDKMPGNAWRIGFIHLMFPNARIIHCVRDPLDTCLSCFQKLFVDGHFWSYDLQELGRHYRRYHWIMQHWEEILPGRVLTVRYEDTVADLEGQARRIVDHVGLDWDPACLDFHRTRRAVLTASNTQVRRPIYASSVRRWEPYRPYLQPLVDALGPLAEHARETPTADANQDSARTRGAAG